MNDIFPSLWASISICLEVLYERKTTFDSFVVKIKQFHKNLAQTSVSKWQQFAFMCVQYAELVCFFKVMSHSILQELYVSFKLMVFVENSQKYRKGKNKAQSRPQ